MVICTYVQGAQIRKLYKLLSFQIRKLYTRPGFANQNIVYTATGHGKAIRDIRTTPTLAHHALPVACISEEVLFRTLSIAQ